MLKNGTRLQSTVCETQVIVVKTSESLDRIRCGGAPMTLVGKDHDGGQLDPAFSSGSVMGKRYVSADGAELLVTRAGKGTLSIDATVLALKEAKPLPASD